MLQFDIALEAEAKPDLKGKDLECESLNSAEIRRLSIVSPRAKKKSTYMAVDGKMPVQTLDWRAIAMTSFNFEDNSFRRIREGMDQLYGQYSKMEYVTKGACKLLSNYRSTNNCKKLEKLQQKDTVTLEANNTLLVVKVADLEVALAKKDKDIRQLQVQSKEGLDWIRGFIGNPGDIMNKARFFDNDMKTEGKLSAPRFITIMVDFRRKIEATLVEIQKLVSELQPKPSQALLLSPKTIP